MRDTRGTKFAAGYPILHKAQRTLRTGCGVQGCGIREDKIVAFWSMRGTTRQNWQRKISTITPATVPAAGPTLELAVELRFKSAIGSALKSALRGTFKPAISANLTSNPRKTLIQQRITILLFCTPTNHPIRQRRARSSRKQLG